MTRRVYYSYLDEKKLKYIDVPKGLSLQTMYQKYGDNLMKTTILKKESWNQCYDSKKKKWDEREYF